MTLANSPDRPRDSSGRRPLWIAMALAVLAVAIAGVVVLGGRSRPSAERRDRGAAVQASTPAQDAAEAVDATPAAGALGPGAFGGPGSAADGSTGPLQASQPQILAEQRPRPRRAPRRQAQNGAPTPSEPPAYRAIGPTAPDEPPPPQT